MAVTQEFRTIMYSVVDGKVVTHRFPFNANEVYGRSKLQKMVARGFTFDDPRGKGGTGQPEVVVTQEVDMERPVMASDVQPTDGDEPEVVVEEALLVVSEAEPVATAPSPVKKWKNMNAQERKAYQLAKEVVAHA